MGSNRRLPPRTPGVVGAFGYERGRVSRPATRSGQLQLPSGAVRGTQWVVGALFWPHVLFASGRSLPGAERQIGR